MNYDVCIYILCYNVFWSIFEYKCLFVYCCFCCSILCIEEENVWCLDFWLFLSYRYIFFYYMNVCMFLYGKLLYIFYFYMFVYIFWYLKDNVWCIFLFYSFECNFLYFLNIVCYNYLWSSVVDNFFCYSWLIGIFFLCSFGYNF